MNNRNKLELLKLKNMVLKTKKLGEKDLVKEKISELKCSMKEFTQNTSQRDKKDMHARAA